MDERELKTKQIPKKPDYDQELIRIIRSGKSDEELRDKISDYHENDLAEGLEQLTREERQRLYTILDDETIAELFTYLEDVGLYIEELEDKKAVDILKYMDSDEIVDVFDELEPGKAEHLFDLLDTETKKDIELLHSYAEDEIGSVMTTNFIAILNTCTVRQAMKALIKEAADHDNISTIYVVDRWKRFCGAMDLTDLIRAREHDDLDSLVTTSYPYVYAKEQIDDCIESIKDYSEDSIPVLNPHKKLLGVITAQDLVEVVDREMGEDYAKLAGLTAEEDLQETLLESMKKRVPWLVLLLFLGFIVSSVVGMFETVVAKLTLVICFQSMILDMAGNVGTQSLAVTIRVLMDEDLTPGEKIHLVFKEMKVGFSNGMLLGSLSFIFIGLYIHFFKGQSLLMSFEISICIAVALMLAMLISSFTGTTIPMFFKKINIDPAVASGPLITTINDLVAVITYYGLTWIFLINFLHLG
ncbi:MAG: magnesium transporter [Anaerostipes sp.]|nr:magnesium transporter [Anaerostipes sp.]